ncbi:MAG: DUF1730 domain-containing protein, partial [Bdellovibrionales bacterium]|nr:DUF1730 domain-containing protein [Bdellovibrionales bacterium]
MTIPALKRISSDTILEAAREVGLFFIGATSIERATATLSSEAKALSDWQSRGYAGEMKYMRRDAAMYATLDAILPHARSIVSFAVPYESRSVSPLPLGAGRIARYAWGLDYHQTLRSRLDRFVETCRTRTPGFAPAARAFSDAVPLLERPLAALAGLGFLGKHGLLLHQHRGSYFFLAEVVWDA